MKLNLKNFAGLSRFKPGKGWMILGVAVVIGGIAAIATRSFLTSQVEAIEARTKGKTVSLVVAKMDLPKGARLSGANLAVREIPVDYAHSAGVDPGSFDRIDGQTLAFPVKSGEMILWGLLESLKPPTFSARLESGRRAMTVPVDEINSISGLIEPGDRIDLLLTLEQNGRKVAVPVLQGVLVMATGQRAVDDPKSGERRQFSTVTLDTSPQQAHDMVLAREAGKLTALLRNPEDGQHAEASVDIAALLTQVRSVAAAAPAGNAASAAGAAQKKAPKGIPVLYGGNASSLQADAVKLGLPAGVPAGAATAAPQPATPNSILAVKQ